VKRRYLRPGDQLGDDETVVVRGGRLHPETLRADANRYYLVYEVYGLSVFAARDITLDELAQQPPLVRFDVLTLTTVGELRQVGLRLQPTGRNPRHYTVVFDDLEDGIERLLRCGHRLWRNPYNEG
jgi:hypothetical protein